MTGSHEVRGSIPLGSTRIRDDLGPLIKVALSRFCSPPDLASLAGRRRAAKRPYQTSEAEHYRYNPDNQAEGCAAANAAYATGGYHQPADDDDPGPS